MNFNISQKIENIRQKPEHIRMRYVWFWLSISMIFIFFIWIFSVKENFRSVDFDRGNLPKIENPVPELKKELPSMESLQGDLGKEIGNQQ